MTRIRRERADTRGRIRTHASILVYRPMYNECFLKRTFHTYTTSPCKESSKTDYPRQQPTTTQKRGEHVSAWERNRTHANTLAVCNIVTQQIHTTWTLAFDILLTYTFSQTNVHTRKQTTLRQRGATSKAQKETNERRNMNNMDSLSFYNDDPRSHHR